MTNEMETDEQFLLKELLEAEAKNSELSDVIETLRAGVYALLVTINDIEKANVTKDPAIFSLVKDARETARETLKEAATT